MATTLKRILAHKREELESEKKRLPRTLLRERISAQSPVRDPLSALCGDPPPGRRSRIIAEIKEASPSKGVLRPGLDAAGLASSYEENGAAVISVLTDQRFFSGSFERLEEVRQTVNTPILAKEFILDPWQLERARSVGADLVLLIVAALEKDELIALIAHTRSLGMEALVEAHNEAEARISLDVGARLIGVNNRDLHTFETHLQTSLDIAHMFPPEVTTISESGIRSREDIEKLEDAGYQAFLVGERFMADPNPGEALAALAGEGRTIG